MSRNALQVASLNGHNQVVKLLLKASADINAQERDYNHEIYAASSHSYDQVITQLLGSDIDGSVSQLLNVRSYVNTRGERKVRQHALGGFAHRLRPGPQGG